MAELDRRAIKALASDTRVAILKSLGARRKMPSELAKEHELAASTVVEHLKILESSGLIKKLETGHKWIYYELTEKGRNIAAPKWPVQHVIVLGLGFLLVFSSFSFFYAVPAEQEFGMVTSKDNVMGAPPLDKRLAGEAAEAPLRPPDIINPASAVLLVGAVLAFYGGWKVWVAVPSK